MELQQPSLRGPSKKLLRRVMIDGSRFEALQPSHPMACGRLLDEPDPTGRFVTHAASRRLHP